MAENRLPSMNHHPKFGIREEALEAGVRTEVQMALNDPRSTPAYDGHPTMNLTSTQKGIFVTLVPAAPELPGDGAASSSAAASTEEGANSSAKKDVSILDAWKNRNSLVLGLCLLLNNLVGVGLLTWLATVYSQQFWITPTGWQYMVVMLGYGLSLWIATSTGPGVVKKWFENNEKVFMLIMFVIGAVVDAGGGTTAFVVLGALLVLGGLAPFLLREPRTPLDPQGPRAAGPDADATTPPGEPHAGVDAAAGTTGRPDSRR